MKRTDPAGALAKLLRSAQGQSDVNVAMPCRVLSYDVGSRTASVQPLIRTGNKDPAPIQGVPVLVQRVMIGATETILSPVLKPGDTVYVVCADNEIKNARSGRVAAPDTGRQHSRNDAVIVGVFPWNL